MAKTFFENFRNAGPIFPGIAFGADADGNIRLADGTTRNINLPDARGNNNKATWVDRVAVPFRYTTKDPVSGDSYERKGILYIPYHESKHIMTDGKIRDGINDIETYGAEVFDVMTDGSEPMGSRSLNATGVRNLINNPNNFDFSFDVQDYDYDTNRAERSGELAKKLSGGEIIKNVETAGRYRADDGTDFLKNLRMLVSRKNL